MPNNISASAQVTLLDPLHFFVFSLEDNSSPGVSLESIAPPQPYGNPIEVTFTYSCINNHLYTVKVWESVDSTPAGVVRCSYSRAVANTSINFRAIIYAEVDVTPGWVSGAMSVVDSTYIGWRIARLICNPNYLVFDDEPDNNKNEATRNTDGFTLSVAGGYTLEPNAQWSVEFEPQITAAQPGAPSNVFGSGQVIVTDTVFDNTYINQALLIKATSNKITCRLPALSTIQNYDWIYIYSNGGNQINATFEGAGTDKIQYNGNKSQMWLGQQECMKLFKAPFGTFGTSIWIVDGDLAGVKNVGRFILSYNLTQSNVIQCAGQELDRSLYPRLWAWVQSTAAVVTETVWNTPTTYNGRTVYLNRTRFSVGDGSTTFRMPLLDTAIFKGIDGSTRIPAVTELDAVGQFQYNFEKVNNNASGTVIGMTDGPQPPPPDDKKLITFNSTGENKVTTAGTYIGIYY